VVARRVERLRGLRFDELPRPRTVTPEQARREGLRDLDRSYPEARRRADEEVLKLVGLLEPEHDLREIGSSVFGEQVAGYYDPRSKRLSVVRRAQGEQGDGALDEITLAHELVHALEDQRFGIDEPSGSTDDASTAYLALVEGTASALMFEYADRHIGVDRTLGSIVGSAFAMPDMSKLPPYVQASLLFPYETGKTFVEELYRMGGGWKLVDNALRHRPPASTEQVLHPRKWLEVEQPVPVRLRAGELLGEGWERDAAGGLGEWDTRQLLRKGAGGEARRASEGWGGGRYELWRRGGAEAAAGERCAAPCVARSALVLGWTWDTPRDAEEFTQAVPGWLEQGLKARPAGEGSWSLRGGWVAFSSTGRATTVAFAPSERQATLLASRAGA
jgi:hypothetical protein